MLPARITGSAGVSPARRRPACGLLERQPGSLRILTQVLTDATDQSIDLRKLSSEERILRLLFFRSFAHVLKDDRGDEERHRHIPIAEAVQLLEDRIDRKRSDDRFIGYYRDLITENMDLPADLLYLPRATDG